MFNSLHLRTFGQDGGIGRYTVPPCTTKRRTTTNLKSKKQPELPENRTVWKFDNQGVKEETFIQTSRRGGDKQPGQRGHLARWQLEDWVVPHLCANSWEEPLGINELLKNDTYFI